MDLISRVGLTYYERMLSFRSVPLCGFQEILTAKAVIVLGAHRNTVDRYPEYQPRLQSDGMRLSSDIYHQLFHRNVGVKRLVS